uniref:Uncharacterized protein n=1 Tax=Tanacetum cinerariifolium TaxID=118510 RepID=A0A699J8U1_TANCI|nr:hypothetical protein [Tanacetum cinerariifolium]
MDQRMNEEVKNLDENIQEIIKEQVKEQTSYAVAADLSEMELKKILIEKMESNRSIHRSDEQRNLYKALFEAYESYKIMLDTYGDIVTLKRRRDDDVDKDEEPSAGSDRGSKWRREGKEQESTSGLKEKATRTTGKSTQGFKASQHPDWFQKQEKPLTSDRAWNKTLPATHGPIHPWISNLAWKDDSRTLFNDLMDTPLDFSAFVMNQLKVDTLTPKLLVALTYELMKGSCKSLVELELFLKEVYKATTHQLDWNNTECRLAMTNMLSEESRIGGANVNNSIDLQSTWNLLEMSTPNVESSLLQSFKSSSGITTSIWIRSLGFIYQNKDKQNRLMRIDELHKFSDDTLNDVRTALDDRLTRIRM